MSGETHPFESLPAYALGCLDEAEAQLVAEHVASCEACRTELRAFQEVVDQLALPLPTAAPPPGLKHRLMDRVQQQRLAASSQPRPAPPRLWSRLRPVAGIAALLLILGLTIVNLLLWQRVSSAEFLTAPQGMRAIVLHNTETAPQASGFIVIGRNGNNGVLVVDELPPLDPARQYQLWLIRDGRSVSAAVFSVAEDGYRGVRISAPESLLEYSVARVTIEPAGGSANPTGKQVLDGLLHNP